jgi:hypothetical protein
MKELHGRQVRLVMEHHELFGFDRQHGIRAPVKTRKLYFKRAAIVGHHYGAHLAASQQKRLTCVEMLRRRVLQKGHDVVHVDFTVHTLDYKHSLKPKAISRVPIDF